MKKLKLAQIYPFVLIIAMYVVYEYRKNDAAEQKSNWEETHQHRITISGKTMGTSYAIVYYDSLDRNLKPAVDSLLESFNQQLSTYIPTSLISQFNQNNQLDSLTPNFLTVLQKSKEIYDLSHGAFDPTVMPLVNAWGFGYKKTKDLPDTNTIDSIKACVGFDKIRFDNTSLYSPKNMELGFGAIAKGYGVDLLGRLLEQRGITTYLVEIGGEDLAKGIKPDKQKWTLKVLYPEKQAAIDQKEYCLVELHNRAMATSGPYWQQKEINGIKYSHTIDPRTGYPVKQDLLSISVLADDCMTADGLATAINVMTLKEVKQFFKDNTQYDGMLLYLENKEIKEFTTPGFEAIKVK
jgi:FAD:protein FMN transferase